MEDATVVHQVRTQLVLRSIRDGHEYPLIDQLLVGREADCSLTLPGHHISRYHAKLTVTPNGIWVEDLHSSNGTFINGIRISGRQPLNVGDEITFYEIGFRLASALSGDADATMIETPDGTRLLSSTELGKLTERNSTQSRRELTDNGCGPRLIIMTAPLRGKVVPLNQPLSESHWRIGRAPDSDIQLEDRTVSLDHARLGKTVNGWLLTSTHARNGLHVNNVATQRSFIKNNDRIRFGRLEVCFKLETSTHHDPLPAEHTKPLWQQPWRLAGIIVSLIAIAATVASIAKYA